MIGVLLTRAMWDKFGEQLASAVPDAQWCALDNGEVSAAGLDTVLPTASIDVAWLTHDVFAEDTSDVFFGRCNAAESLRLLQSATASADGPRFQALLQRGVRVATSHVTGVSISEYVIGAVFRHYQQPNRWQRAQEHREWRQHDFREVNGTTWLIVGLGSIGATLSRMVRACGARVIGVRRFPKGCEPVDLVITPDRIPEFVPHADVLVLCAPPSATNHHMVDASLLSRMKERSVLVNVARGSLVDEAALEAALDNGIPEAAILDVFAKEPLPSNSRLWSHPRAVVTPHNAGWGSGRYDRAVDVFIDNLRRYQKGDPLKYEIAAHRMPAPYHP